MPKFSQRQQLLRDIRLGIALATADDDDDTPEDLAEALFYLETRRFLAGVFPVRRAWWFFDNEFANASPDHFRALFRTTKLGFLSLLRVIEGHPAFTNDSHHEQSPVYVHRHAVIDYD
jgi:hypothetical protein